jgi:hypothetical protein
MNETSLCTECGREFGSEDAMEKVGFHPRAPFFDRSLTLLQHYNAKHRFECNDSDCEDEFMTEAARDLVQLSH